MINQGIMDTLKIYADAYSIPLDIIVAIVKVESNEHIYAYRSEPHYRYLVDVKTQKPFRRLTTSENTSEVAAKDFPYFGRISSRNTEWWGQQASWGPMQIMGAVAREYGFEGAFPELCTWTKGIMYSCEHLQKLKHRFLGKHGWAGVIAAYNAGSPRYVDNGDFENQHYVDKVREHGGFEFMVD